MQAKTVTSILLSLVAIAVCGSLGALAGVGAMRLIGLSGTLGAITAALVGMIVATLAFGLGVVLLRAVGWLR